MHKVMDTQDNKILRMVDEQVWSGIFTGVMHSSLKTFLTMQTKTELKMARKAAIPRVMTW